MLSLGLEPYLVEEFTFSKWLGTQKMGTKVKYLYVGDLSYNDLFLQA